MNFLRQLDILNPDDMLFPVTIIGVGGIGSIAAVTLAKMGFKEMILYDGDSVEEHNRPNQWFRQKDEGRLKVEAMKEIIAEFAEWCEITAIPEKFGGQGPLEGIVVCGVDSMEIQEGRWGRKEIWQTVRNNINVPLYLDGRIRGEGEAIELYIIRPNQIEDIEAYEETLYPNEDAISERCTAQDIIYLGTTIASWLAAEIKKWLKKEEHHTRVVFDFKIGALILE